MAARDEAATEAIRVSPTTKAWLDSLKVIPEQPYDSVLQSLREIVSKRAKKNGA